MANRHSGQPVNAYRQHNSCESPAQALLFVIQQGNLIQIKVLQTFNAHIQKDKCIILHV